MSTSPDMSALVCIPSAIPAGERQSHYQLAEKLFTELAEGRTELPNGYEFHFRADVFEAITRFVANERKCCPFLDFDVISTAHDGPIRLRMTGPPGAREVLDAELNLSVSS
jgi:hypothetical protein